MGNLITVGTSGIAIQSYEDILADIKAAVRDNVDPGLNLEADSYEGQVAAIVAAKLRDLAEAVLELASAIDPDNAESGLLDIVCAITGTVRAAASKGLVTVTVTASGAWSVTTAGDLVVQVSGYPDRLFQNRGAASGGAGTTDVVLEAVTAGYFEAPAGTVTVKITGPAAITAVTNAAAASPGSETETDAELRISRQRDLLARASSHVDGIKAKLEALDGVVKATVRENTTMIPDADGLPAKSVECIVDDRNTVADDVIAQAIWDSKAGGIEPYGTTDTGTATDTEDGTHGVSFTRPTIVDGYMEITIKGDADASAVKAAIEALASEYGAGDDGEALMLVGAATRVPGVTGVVSYKLDTVDPPVASANITIGARQRLSLVAADIDVVFA